MKHKLSKILGLGLTLALLTSLLLTAAPVSAATMTPVTAVPADATETATTTYTIGFTPVTTLVIDKVEIEFAGGFDASAATLGTVTGIGEGNITDVGPTATLVTYTLTVSELLEGDAITITLGGIENPTGAGEYEVTVRTMSGAATIDEGIADVTITPLPVSFAVVAGTNDTVNVEEAFLVTITAKDAVDGGGATEMGYIGAHFINFSYGGSPTDATIPDFELITFDEGVGTSPANFILTLATESETDITVIATDAVLTGVTGESEIITITPRAFSKFSISGEPTTVEAGDDFATDNIMVTAQNADGEPVTDYVGTVSWTSSDPSAELPDDYTFILTDEGEYEFSGEDFTLKTVGEEGTQTITVTDATAGVSKTSGDIPVTPADASEIIVEAEPTSIRADNTNSSTITATAYDEFGNVDTDYAGTATFTASLGDIAEDEDFTAGTAGEAIATLTSNGEVGTATIKVIDDATILPYVTTTVELLVAVPTEVWVDDDGADTNPGTLALPVETIQAGINIAAVDGTVNVLPGTYILSSSININITGLTVQSTDGAEVTIIEASDLTFAAVGAINIDNSNVTFEGFTVKDSGDFAIEIANTSGVKIQHNVITGCSRIPINISGTGHLVAYNTIEDSYGIYLNSGTSGHTIEYNTITGCTATTEGAIIFTSSNDDNAITGNIITGSLGSGIHFQETGSAHDENLISGNTISGSAEAAIGIAEGLTITNLHITGNDITDNAKEGILIASWGSTNAINNNNIYVNTPSIHNDTAKSVDAELNWWGTALESAIVGMVSEHVDYSPWLNAPYPDGASTTAGDPAIVLETGWNLISLPLVPTSSAITAVLADLITEGTADEVRTYDQGAWSNWASSEPSGNLEIMEDGPGYWILMNTADTLIVPGSELPAPPETPHSYNVFEGWNLIGFKSLLSVVASDYLDAVDAVTQAMYSYDAGNEVYSIILHTDDLVPGNGYWLAVSADGVIYP